MGHPYSTYYVNKFPHRVRSFVVYNIVIVVKDKLHVYNAVVVLKLLSDSLF